MREDTTTARTDRPTGRRLVGTIQAHGMPFVLAATAFFLGSGVLTRSGQPGASTPVPWLASHASWVVATALVAAGTVRVARRTSGLRTGIAGDVASGAFGLGVLHTLQWTTWVYVDVIAYRQGEHGLLREPLLHPFGTGHALMYGVLVGIGVAALARSLTHTTATRRVVDWTGIVVGTATALAATASLLTVAPVRSPASLATIGLIATAFGWLFALGVSIRPNDAEREAAT